MALQSTSTAQSWVRDLADKFTARFANSSTINTVRATLDSSGWPMLFMSNNGTETEGNPVIAIRIKEIDTGATDIFGNSALPFAPHQCEVAYEKTSGGFPIPAFPDLATVYYEVSKIGVKVLDEAIANGTAVTATSMTASTPAVTLDSIDWPNKGA